MNLTTCQFWMLIAVCVVFSTHASAQSSPCVRLGDEIWLISARQLGAGNNSNLQYQKLCGGIWQPSCCSELFDANVQEPNCSPVVFVHGYQTNLHDAKLRGVQVYHNLFCNCVHSQPIRYIIWAWKSERESRRVIREFTAKARHATQLGDAFAMTLNQLQSRPPTIVAYSLGAQVSIAALVQSNVYSGAPVQLAVIAAATDCGFSNCCLQMQNCGNIACSDVFSNRGDVAIRAARVTCRLAKGCKPDKFELIAPMYPDQLGEVNIIDITPISTRKHSIVRYTSLPVIIARVNELLARSSAVQIQPAGNAVGQSIVERSPIQMAELNTSRDVCIMR